ncbi:hypothetical protein ACW73L_08565 [Methylolobus aquaticus]
MSTLNAFVEKLSAAAAEDSERFATYVLTAFMAVLALIVLL